MCMATKTISLSVEAYGRLRSARRRPGESFSQVVMRATWPEMSVTGADLLKLWEGRPALFSDQELDTVEELKTKDVPAADKWTTR